jgi:hypothetical protein
MPSIFDALTLPDAQKVLGTVRLSEGDREALDFKKGDSGGTASAGSGRSRRKARQFAPRWPPSRRASSPKASTGRSCSATAPACWGASPAGRSSRAARSARTPDGKPLAPTAEEQALIGEVEAALTVWWDKRRPLPTLRDALDLALRITRAPLRLVVADAPRDEAGAIRLVPREGANPLIDALDTLHLDAPEPDACGTFTDPATRRQVGVFSFRQQVDDKPFAKLLSDEGPGRSRSNCRTSTTTGARRGGCCPRRGWGTRPIPCRWAGAS